MTRKRVLQFDPVPMDDGDDPREGAPSPGAPLTPQADEPCPEPVPTREWARLRRCGKCGKRHIAPADSGTRTERGA